jgi:hypothetical protein
MSTRDGTCTARSKGAVLIALTTETATIEATATGAKVPSVCPDHQFEGVERPGERRVERAGDGTSSAATDHQP